MEDVLNISVSSAVHGDVTGITFCTCKLSAHVPDPKWAASHSIENLRAVRWSDKPRKLWRCDCTARELQANEHRGGGRMDDPSSHDGRYMDVDGEELKSVSATRNKVARVVSIDYGIDVA